MLSWRIVVQSKGFHIDTGDAVCQNSLPIQSPSIMHSGRILSALPVLAVSAFLLLPLAAGAGNGPSENEMQKKYIVVLKDDLDADAVSAEMGKAHGLALGQVYNHALKGFAATIPAARLEQIRGDARVAFISEDKEVQASVQVLPTGINRTDAELNLSNKGTGIGVAVIDTGIDLTHPDLAGNIVANKSCVTGK